MKNDKIESPLDVPMIDADAPYSSSEKQIDEQGRPFIIVAGRKYVLAEEEDDPDLGNLPEDSRLASVASPPREVTFFAKTILFLRSTSASSFGWIWLCFSMLFALFMIGVTGTFVSIYEKSATWEEFAKGRVVSCEEANFSINGETPYIWRFEGVAPDGSAFSGRSYASEFFDSPEEVVVEKARGATDVLRVQGGRLAMLEASWGTFFMSGVLALFLVIGIVLGIVSPVLTGRRFLKLLISGKTALGVPVDVRYSGARINNVPEQIVTFRFRAEDGNNYETKIKTLRPEDLTDAPAEILFYDPENPKKTVPLDALPKGIKLQEGRGFGASFHSVVVPFFFIVVFLAEIGATFYYGARIERATFSVPSESAAVAEPLETRE